MNRYPTVTIATLKAWRSAGMSIRVVQKVPGGVIVRVS